MVAYFEPIEKTFRYDYGELAAPLENTVTLNRNNLQAAQFAVPSMTGWKLYFYPFSLPWLNRPTNSQKRGNNTV